MGNMSGVRHPTHCHSEPAGEESRSQDHERDTRDAFLHTPLMQVQEITRQGGITFRREALHVFQRPIASPRPLTRTHLHAQDAVRAQNAPATSWTRLAR